MRQTTLWRRKGLILLLCGFAAAFLCCAGLIGYGLRTDVPSGVKAGDWPIEGLSLQELGPQLAAYQQFLYSKPVRLIAKPALKQGELTSDKSLQDLGLEMNIQTVLGELQPLTEGSLFHRAVYRWHLRGAELPITAAFNGQKLTSTLQQAFSALYAAEPVNAERIIQPDDTITYVPETIVEKIDEPRLLALLEQRLAEWSVQTWVAAARGEKLYSVAASAPALSADFAASADSAAAQLHLPLRMVHPAVTVATLKAEGIERKIAEFTTQYPATAVTAAVSGKGRAHNVCSTAKVIQNTKLKPGELFDYNKYVEETEKKYGYQEAPVIINGELVPGIGGGICQVSSTLYNAVLRAGLEIVERKNHSLPVSYVPLGQDATFAKGYINFRFRNSTGQHLLITTEGDDRKLTIKLFGQIPADLSYDIVSNTVEKLPVPVKYVHNGNLPAGKQVRLTAGKPGYVVETYRITYQNGVQIDKKLLSRDTYKAQPKLIAVNQGANREQSPNQPSPQPIEDGIQTPVN